MIGDAETVGGRCTTGTVGGRCTVAVVWTRLAGVSAAGLDASSFVSGSG